MKILIQWTRKTPTDWQTYDSKDWALLPKKPEPTGLEVIEDIDGWVYQICVMGVWFTADHYAVEDLPNGNCKVTYWNDDPVDYPEGEKYACEWFFYPVTEEQFKARQPKYEVIRYDQSEVAKRVKKGLGFTTYKSFSEFVKPSEIITKHGIWVSDELNKLHDKARSVIPWWEWYNG